MHVMSTNRYRNLSLAVLSSVLFSTQAVSFASLCLTVLIIDVISVQEVISLLILIQFFDHNFISNSKFSSTDFNFNSN